MRRVSIVAGMLALGAMLIASCGGGDDELAKAIEELPRSALTTMVLTADELGSIVDGFEIDTDSGIQDNATAADDSLNPDDDAGDFDEAGRITGYQLGFGAANIGALLEAGKGIAAVYSEVELFATGEDATADIQRKIDELQDFEGQNIDGRIIEAHEEFDVTGLGDEAGGIEFNGRLDGLDVTPHSTIVYFRIGRLQAAVVVSALDDQDLRDEVEAAAGKLEERVKGVALGEIDEDAVEIPTQAATVTSPAPVSRPDGVPNLAGVALQLSDLPEGFVIEEESYEALPEVEFGREFGVGDALSVQVGRTQVVGVQNTVKLFENVTEASLFLGVFEDLLLSEEGRAGFAASFASEAGFGPELSDFQTLPFEAGDEGIVLLGLLKTGLGDFAFAFMLVRVDRGVALVNVTALAGQFDLQDIVPLARLEAERLVSGPHSSSKKTPR